MTERVTDTRYLDLLPTIDPEARLKLDQSKPTSRLTERATQTLHAAMAVIGLGLGTKAITTDFGPDTYKPDLRASGTSAKKIPEKSVIAIEGGVKRAEQAFTTFRLEYSSSEFIEYHGPQIIPETLLADLEYATLQGKRTSGYFGNIENLPIRSFINWASETNEKNRAKNTVPGDRDRTLENWEKVLRMIPLEQQTKTLNEYIEEVDMVRAAAGRVGRVIDLFNVEKEEPINLSDAPTTNELYTHYEKTLTRMSDDEFQAVLVEMGLYSLRPEINTVQNTSLLTIAPELRASLVTTVTLMGPRFVHTGLREKPTLVRTTALEETKTNFEATSDPYGLAIIINYPTRVLPDEITSTLGQLILEPVEKNETVATGVNRKKIKELFDFLYTFELPNPNTLNSAGILNLAESLAATAAVLAEKIQGRKNIRALTMDNLASACQDANLPEECKLKLSYFLTTIGAYIDSNVPGFPRNIGEASDALKIFASGLTKEARDRARYDFFPIAKIPEPIYTNAPVAEYFFPRNEKGPLPPIPLKFLHLAWTESGYQREIYIPIQDILLLAQAISNNTTPETEATVAPTITNYQELNKRLAAFDDSQWNQFVVQLLETRDQLESTATQSRSEVTEQVITALMATKPQQRGLALQTILPKLYAAENYIGIPNREIPANTLVDLNIPLAEKDRTLKALTPLTEPALIPIAEKAITQFNQLFGEDGKPNLNLHQIISIIYQPEFTTENMIVWFNSIALEYGFTGPIDMIVRDQEDKGVSRADLLVFFLRELAEKRSNTNE